ncbi:MAG: translation initiation factor IF-2 [Acidimicrobiaceae bacterium]|nr:translation initiation factor IF-2 [Acidimicrobiaceae bacterium]MYF43384.1 translation initiation factor IF-2 [Acidimicrobiaceae bacterium]
MPGKIRVHELAKELGLTNQETLDLCFALSIGVKSHSSSIVEAQADRVRRRAERDGLLKPPPPPEPVKVAEPETVEPEPPKPEPVKPEAEAPVTSKPEAEAPSSQPAVAEKPAAEVSSESRVRAAPAARAPAARAAPPVEPDAPATVTAPAAAEVTEPAAAKPKVTISSSGSVAPAKRVVIQEPPPVAEEPPAPKPASPKAQASAAPPRPLRPGTPPVSRSGKPIPPPPPPRRLRPPPPQGTPSRGGPAAPERRPSSGASRPAGPRPQADRPAGPRRGAPAGGPRSLGGPRPVAPGPPGRPGGGRGAPGGAQRRPPRRKSRRRRVREELQPMDVPTYTPRHAAVPEGVVVVERASAAQDFGPKLNRTAADVVRFLMQHGEMVTATQSLSDEMMELFAAEIGAEIRLVDPGEEQEAELRKLLGIDGDDDSSVAPLRAPVITVMGHVDHGKTLLLDRIRDTNVVDGEAGGITQHIGAYQVERNDRTLTFIDTPGHEAFTAMRARGAGATDIVVLVVAADDGVMPQTVEAINHAKAAEVPIVVAVNKIDRPNADPQRTVAGVAEQGLVPEAWGGETIYCEVSALTGEGLEDLLDQILLVAEVEDLRASSEGRAGGVVLESNLDIGRGPVATVLVQKGTLHIGDPVVAGAAWGRVRALLDDRGEPVDEAVPSAPVQVLGLSEVAIAGDAFAVAPNEKIAGRVADTREHWQRLSSLGREAHALSGGAKLEDLFTRIQRGETATLNVIVKADVNGSLEAVTESLRKLETGEVRIAIVHRGVGGITENDIQLASASNATIIGFNVRPDRKAREAADAENVEIRTYEIIYKLLEDVSSAMVGMLAPDITEIVTGDAEVRQVFRIPRVGAVAGCYVQNGTITRGAKVRFLRDGAIIWKGTVNSLKRFTDDVREVQSGFECGIGLSNFQDLKAGDIIETFEEREVARTLDQ